MEGLLIRYCGGCRARYDRVQWAQSLADCLRRGDISSFPAAGQSRATRQITLVVCGCEARCPDIPAGAHVVTSPSCMDGKHMSLEEMAELLRKEWSSPQSSRP